MHDLTPAVSYGAGTWVVVWSRGSVVGGGGSNASVWSMRSRDGGATWVDAIQISNSLYSSIQPAITFTGTYFVTVWIQNCATASIALYCSLKFNFVTPDGSNISFVVAN